MTAERDRLDGRTVLLVEDELLIAMDIEAELVDRGVKVCGPVTRVSEGIPIVENDCEDVDAAILDVNLRGEDVYPIAERLAARGVPFLFHTGHGDAQKLQARFGRIPVCAKPVQTSELIDEVARLILEDDA
ncbi:MAG: response regulator [Pseudomonadota bacterium]